jgi:PDZ domain-containing protein
MSRRLVAFLVALGLAIVLSVVAFLQPVPWVRFQPGPTFDTLHTAYGKQMVVIKGHKVYPDKGELRMITIIPDGPKDNVTLLDALLAWANPNDAVIPKEALYPKHQTNAQAQKQSAAEMSSSQDTATAAALTAAGIRFKTEVRDPIRAVDKNGAAAGKLQVGDELIAVGGKTADTIDGFVSLVRAVKPGTKLQLTILRKGVHMKVSVVTRPNASTPTESRIGVSLDPNPTVKLALPFEVKFQLADQIGGPSAGMMFALAIYDLLTPGSLTGGKVIAGTGEISPKGVVGQIGGIGQKLVAAQRDGARLFLAPAGNCAEAARSHYNRNKLRVVKVRTLSDAIDALNTWRKDPSAALPGCSS